MKYTIKTVFPCAYVEFSPGNLLPPTVQSWTQFKLQGCQFLSQWTDQYRCSTALKSTAGSPTFDHFITIILIFRSSSNRWYGTVWMLLLEAVIQSGAPKKKQELQKNFHCSRRPEKTQKHSRSTKTPRNTWNHTIKMSVFMSKKKVWSYCKCSNVANV